MLDNLDYMAYFCVVIMGLCSCIAIFCCVAYVVCDSFKWKRLRNLIEDFINTYWIKLMSLWVAAGFEFIICGVIRILLVV